jgi:phosphoglycolate phosphatase-like HAD superfamily hydrolase
MYNSFTTSMPSLVQQLLTQVLMRYASICSNDLGSRQVAVRPTAILFDLDGTLIDTMGRFAQVAADVLNEYVGLPKQTARHRYLETSGIPFHQQLALIVPNHPLTTVMSDAFESRKLRAITSVTMSPGTIAALRFLREAGVGIGVSSNNLHNHVANFASSSPVKFDFALGYTGILYKGEPHIAHAMVLYGCSATDLLFVGDSLSDCFMAQRCGVPFIGITGTNSKYRFCSINPHAVCICSIEQLPQLIINNNRLGGGTTRDSK